MRAVVVYESMFGNTHSVAECVGAGLSDAYEVSVIPVGDATEEVISQAQLVVVGGPTHVHGISNRTSRRSAAEQAAHDDTLELDPDAEGPGLREWFGRMPRRTDHRRAAAFDTRVDASAVLTGRASKGIAKRLSHHGFDVVDEPESFLVDRQNRLLQAECDRATDWGRELAALTVGTS
jgi:hypothetical protein